jgi:cell division protein ZipA
MESNNMQLGILVLGVVILFLILLELWFKRRRHRVAEISIQDTYSSPVQQSINESGCAINLAPTEKVQSYPTQNKTVEWVDDILVLSVLAKSNTRFGSYDLLQAITATGMQFGEMNIFHYYLPTNAGRKALFSLASATKPGDFNLDSMGDFSCVGLTLFMDLKGIEDPEFAFSLMFKTAEQLADDLDGELRAGIHTPWNLEVAREYQQRIAQYRKNK